MDERARDNSKQYGRWLIESLVMLSILGGFVLIGG